MIKRIVKLSIAGALVVGITGCTGENNLQTPNKSSKKVQQTKKKKKPNFTIAELVNLPHPLRAIMQNEKTMAEVGIDETQEQEINDQMLVVYPPYIMGRMFKAQKLENEIKMAVMKDDKNAIELKNKIDQLAKLKREVLDKHIESLNVLATILTPKQYKKSMEMFREWKLKTMHQEITKQLKEL